jgi:hypothetical protein
MRTMMTGALLALLLVGCASIDRTAGRIATDPGRLPSASMAVNIPGLGPCNDGPDRALRLDPGEPMNVLVHGCKGSTGRFHALAEVLAFHGQQTACFAYDDRDSLMVSSGQLVSAVTALATHLDQPKITVIGHSMGGLVARKALVAERADALDDPHIDLQLVTVSAPFAGIAAASACAVPALRILSLGLNDLACWLITGDNWYEITHVSDFIRKPGTLAPQVHRHLKVVTDERNTCRRRDTAGQCVEGDYVFSVAEQRYPPVTGAPATTDVEVAAGHVEIIGEFGVTPHKLIAVFQREGIVRPTPAGRRAAFGELLARVYGDARQDDGRGAVTP